MRLLNEIEEVKKLAISLSQNAVDKYTDFVRNHIFQTKLEEIINQDLSNNNPDKLFEEYVDYFNTKSLPTKTIDTNTTYYRGRIGNEVIYGADNGHNRSFILPYFQHKIEAPPPIYTNGGRFNRQGVSYLYLSDTVETCLAEVHLQIGQNCSVGEFKCKEQINVIDLTKFADDIEMKIWLKILTQPVYNETKYIYNLTCFLADVFKKINNYGIYFESVQAEGHNIVCFDPSYFQLIKYSEKIFTAKKIKYDYEQFNDAIREYSNNDNYKYISSYNEYEDERNEQLFEYLNNWIDHEKKKK